MNESTPVPKKSRFIFEISFDEIPHTQDTVQYVFGTDFYNPDFPIHTHATQTVFDTLRYAYTHCLLEEMKHLSKCKCDSDKMNPEDLSYYKYLQSRTSDAEKIMDSIKFARTEEIKSN